MQSNNVNYNKTIIYVYYRSEKKECHYIRDDCGCLPEFSTLELNHVWLVLDIFHRKCLCACVCVMFSPLHHFTIIPSRPRPQKHKDETIQLVLPGEGAKNKTHSGSVHTRPGLSVMLLLTIPAERKTWLSLNYIYISSLLSNTYKFIHSVILMTNWKQEERRPRLSWKFLQYAREGKMRRRDSQHENNRRETAEE